MLEDSRRNCMIGMRAQPGIAYVAHHLVRSQILCQRTGAVEVSLHASVERLEPALQHVGFISRQVEHGRTAARKQRMRELGSGIHTMSFELRTRYRSGDKLARSSAGTHAVERLERKNGTQAQRIAPKDTSHGVVNHKQCMGLTSRATQRAQIGHAQSKTANRVNEPPQVRSLDLKRSIKALGRRSKRRNRRFPHEHNVEGIKAASKRIGKIVCKGYQAIPRLHNPQLRQRCRHMRGRNKTHLTRAGPCSPDFF